MLKKTNLLFVLFSIVIIVLLISTFIDFRFLRSDSFNNPIKEIVSPTPAQKYIYSFQTGYEGYNKDITYTITIAEGKHATFASSTKLSEVMITDTDAGVTHTISAFNNDGAGFSGTAELWKNTELKTKCPTCKLIPGKISLDSQLSDGDTYSDGKKLFYLFPLSNNQVFLIIETSKANPIEGLISGLTVDIKSSTSVTPPVVKTKDIKLYFVNTSFKPVINCDEVVPVIREIPAATQAVATEAMALLVTGPTAADAAKGYTSSFPAGSAVKSVSINQAGDATVDFNSVVNTGGGSCHFRILQTQIEETLRQFPSVKRIKITVNGKGGEEIFQP